MESNIKYFLLVFLGGGIGATGRYWMSGAVYRFLPPDFPYGNLAVNVVGCFLIGVLMSLAQERFIIPPAFRVFLAIGILGGFTTFSSFSYETVALFESGQLFTAAVNVAATVVGCLCATFAGIVLGRLL